jgi:polysaccharide biosynthesis transport protein
MSEQPTEPSASKQSLSLTPEVSVARRVRPTRTLPREIRPQGVSRNDILFALFKHKKKIALGAALGMLGAGAVLLKWPSDYESDAKLLVRYVVERTTVDNVDPRPGSYGSASDAIIESELQILTSWDLAVQTAEAIGPKRLLPNFKGTVSKEAAAATIASGLHVDAEKGSTIMFVSYRNRDPELATMVLNELVNRYFNKHLEVHRSAGAFDFVTQQTDQVRSRLNQTEDALRDLKAKAGIVSLDASTTSLNAEAERVEEQLHFADADLAEEQARFRQLNGTPGGVTIVPDSDKPSSDKSPASDTSASGKSEASPTPPVEIPIGVIQRYQVLSSGLQKLRLTQLDLFAKYTPDSQMVKTNQAEIDDVDHQLRNLEHKYPDLPTRAGAIGAGNDSSSPAATAAHIAGLRAKRNALASRLEEIRKKIEQLAQISPQMADLERQKQLEEANYKYFEATLEKARVDEALDPSKIPNISAVQRPSPPVLETKTRNKIALAVGLAGVGLAVGFALLKELILSATIRRPVEIEKHVGITSLMSIPYNSQFNGSPGKSNGKSGAIATRGDKKLPIAPWDTGHFIRPYSEAIRDRLGLYFELHNLTHKPKLVGVASLSGKAGTSTLAAGLAASLSETNDGKVLLVDVNLGPDQVHPFFRGKPAYMLNTALESQGEIDPAAENLYLAMVGNPSAGPAQLGLKKFFDLMPNLKASEFDYIIFDMPPLEQTSPSWGMAPFMDKMIVVVEAERNSRDAVHRVYRRLVHERENVSLVLNKVRSYAPKRLELDY